MKKLIVMDSVETFDDIYGWDVPLEQPVVIASSHRLSADLYTACKSWKTAIRRFRKAFDLGGKDPYAFSDLVDEVERYCNEGTMIFSYSQGTSCIAWYVTELEDGEWYVSVVITDDLGGLWPEPSREEVLNRVYDMAVKLSRHYDYREYRHLWRMVDDFNACHHEREEIFLEEDTNENGDIVLYVEDDYFIIPE